MARSLPLLRTHINPNETKVPTQYRQPTHNLSWNQFAREQEDWDQPSALMILSTYERARTIQTVAPLKLQPGSTVSDDRQIWKHLSDRRNIAEPLPGANHPIPGAPLPGAPVRTRSLQGCPAPRASLSSLSRMALLDSGIGWLTERNTICSTYCTEEVPGHAGSCCDATLQEDKVSSPAYGRIVIYAGTYYCI